MLRRVPVLVGIWLATSTLGAAAHETWRKEINIVHPFVVETEQREAALHMRIKNTGHVQERLVGASTPVAAKVSILDGSGALAIPGRGELALGAQGPRMMLTGLAKPLRAYDSFDLTLVFERMGPVKVEVIVEEKVSN